MQSERKLLISILLVSFILVAKFVGAFLTNSLALFSDSWHLVTDLASLIISWFGLKASLKPATYKHTFGHYRHGILTALINNISLIFISIFILYKAVGRFLHPVAIEPKGMMIFAILGLAVNTFIILNLKDNHNMNVRSAFLHFMGDALADIGVLTGGIIIYFTGWMGIDTLLSAMLACLILKSALKMTIECINIFLEAAPKNISIEQIKERIQSIEGVLAVNDVHVWSLSVEVLAMTGHICVQDCSLKECEEILHNIQHLLQDDFGIGHSTIQFESSPCSSCFHSKSDHGFSCNMCIDQCPEKSVNKLF